MNPLPQLLRHPILARAEPTTLRRLAAASGVLVVEARRVVVRAGSTPTHVYVVVDGGLVLTRKDARTVLHGAVDAPSVFGDATWTAHAPWPVTAKAARAATIVRVPGPAFDRFVDDDPRVAAALYRVTCVRLAGQIQARLFVTRLSTDAQLVSLVRQLAARAPDGWARAAPTALAAALGVDRKTVFRNLRDLVAKGVVERDGDRLRAAFVEESTRDDAPPIVAALTRA